MNACAFTGNLVSDVELKMTPAGKSVCSFRVAVKRPRTKDVTDFLTFVAWDNQAETISKYFHKGDCIGLNGYAATREWENKDGKKQRVVEFTVTDFSFVMGKKDKGTETETEGIAYAAPASGNFEELSPDDDLPF